MDISIFLTKKDVLRIHKTLIQIFGGIEGIRDNTLLDSAIEMPQSGFGNEYFHKTIFDKASAYYYHLSKNHAFIDGNKRIGLACSDVFLEMNGYSLELEEEIAYNFSIRVSTEKNITKEEISIFLESNSKKIK